MKSMDNSSDDAFIVVHMYGLRSDVETTWEFTTSLPQHPTPGAVLVTKAVQAAL